MLPDEGSMWHEKKVVELVFCNITRTVILTELSAFVDSNCVNYYIFVNELYSYIFTRHVIFVTVYMWIGSDT